MNRQLLIIIILLVAVVGIGYWWFTSVFLADEETQLVIDEAMESRLVSYRRLKSVAFDMTAFQDEFFRELVQLPELLEPLVPTGQNLGRSNPYAAYVGGASPVPASGPTPR